MPPVDNLLVQHNTRHTSFVVIIRILLLSCALIVSACAGNTIKTPSEEKSFSSYIDLAHSYLQQRNARSAIHSLEQAEEIDDEDPRLLQAYGLYYQLIEDNEQAEEMFLRALEIDPSFSLAHNNYGVFLSQSNRNAEALIQLSEAAKDPNYAARAASYVNMAEVALEMNNLPLAANSMKKAAVIDSNPRYFLRAAHMLYLNKQLDEGQEYFNRFLKKIDNEGIEPTSDQLQIGYGLARERKDKGTEEYIKQRLQLLVPQISTQEEQ